MSERKIIGYSLQPVYEVPRGGIRTAAVMSCLATSEVLSGSGGGGEVLSPKFVQFLRDYRGCWNMDDPIGCSVDIAEEDILRSIAIGDEI